VGPVPRLDAASLAARIAAPTAPWDAWRHLLGLWNLPASAADAARAAACPPVLAPGVYCLRGRGSLDKLTAQERPAMLLLRDGDAQRWAALLGADARHARLRLDDATVDVPRIALDRAWGGDYAIVWRAPEEVVAPITAASPPAALAWVRDGLAPKYLDNDAPATLDAAMRDAVLRFQRDRGLAADGVVGPETLMALAARDAGPRLRAELE
jgi:general secretion pathway protein A